MKQTNQGFKISIRRSLFIAMWALPCLALSGSNVVTLPNDPLIVQQWALSDIMVDKAWAWGDIKGSKDVVVAIVDSGIKLDHPDLQENLWTNEAELHGLPGVDDDNNGYVDDIHGYNFIAGNGNPDDDNGHGTHCAGTIGATPDNHIGIAGINWNVKLMAVKVLDSKMSVETAQTLADGIDYAVKNGAHIINASFGGPHDEALRAAILRAEKAGVLVVAAAGNYAANNDEKPFFPASYGFSNTISVAAIDRENSLWLAIGGGSNYGPLTVDIAAPGVGILSTHIQEGGYKILMGTSQAAPIVAGVAALVKAQNPQMKAPELKERLLFTAERRSFLKGKVLMGGVINAYRALMNLRMQIDPNDPNYWVKNKNLWIASPHPVKQETVWEEVIEVPDAKEMSLFFTRLKLEDGTTLDLIDREGHVMISLDGIKLRTWSPIVKSNYIKLRFSHPSYTKESYGLDLRRVSYR